MERAAIQQKLYAAISEIMEIPLEEVRETSSSDTVATWDSMTQMSLILALEEGFQIRLSHIKATEFSNVKSILAILDEALKSK